MEIQGCIFICFAATFLWQTSVILTVDVENTSSTVVVESSKSTVAVENVQPESYANQIWSYVVSSPLITQTSMWFNTDDPTKGITSIYDITVKDINGNDVSLSIYKGQVLLIVNYASKCLYTKENVEYLSQLAKTYSDGFKVLMFPSNYFYENPGGNDDGKALQTAHPEFDVFYEVDVNGADASLMYKYLKKQLPGTYWISSNLRWNFVKFLVDKSGKPYQRFATSDSFQSIDEAVKILLDSVQN